MSGRLLSWLSFVGLGLMALAGCGFFNSPLSPYRYRLTVEVDTPGGLKAGSSVVEIRTTKQGSWNIDSPGNVGAQGYGEAAVVNLPNGNKLFAVEPSNWGFFLVQAYEATEQPTEITGDMIKRIQRARAYGDVMSLPAWTARTANDPGYRIYPLLVRFRDRTDPMTVEEVPFDNLAASFGPGYSLRRITIQITNDPLTTGVQAILPWLEDYRKAGARLNGSTSASIGDNVLSNNLSSGSFKTAEP